MRTNSSTRWFWSVAVLALGLGAILFFSGGKSSQSPALLLDEVGEGDRTRGIPGSRVILVEYGDYQCPACSTYHPIVEEVLAEYGGRITFVYRHFPLRQIHRQADLASRAAEAAGIQGKFWEMHALLYERQRLWADSLSAKERMAAFARELGLNEERFLADFDSEAVRDKVENDLQGGIRSGVRGTPTFFLNGRELQDPGADLGAEIEAELNTP